MSTKLGLQLQLLVEKFSIPERFDSPFNRVALFLTVVVIVPVLIFEILTKWRHKARQVNRLGGPRRYPLLGNFPFLMGPAINLQGKISEEINKTKERIIRLWVGHKPYVIIGEGKAAEKILSGYTHIEKGEPYAAFHRVLAESLPCAPGQKWKADRKALNPGFGYSNFDGFLQTFNEQAHILLKIFDDLFPGGKEDGDGKKVKLLHYFNRCTLDSVFQTVLGSKESTQLDPEHNFIQKLIGIIEATRDKLLRPYLNIHPLIWQTFGKGKEEDKCISSLMDYASNIIQKKIIEKEETGDIKGTNTRPFIAYFLDNKNDIQDIAYQVNALCFAGSETSASAMNYLLFLLALHPNVQDDLIAEVDSMFENMPEDQENPTLSDLTSLKYTEFCIKETLRLYPPVPGWMRKISKDVVLENGKILPKGTGAVIIPWDIHRNPEVFPDPEKFNPDRWLDPERRIGPGDWVPFSYGPRNCIGHKYAMIQMKSIIAQIFRKYRVQTEMKREDFKVLYGLVLEAKPGIEVTLTRR